MTPEFKKARRHLSRRDGVLKQIIKQVGPCTLQFNADHFALLARSIISQQISTKAAVSISAKLLERLGKKGLTPRAILAQSDEMLRGAGLSAAKVKYLRDLSTQVISGSVLFKGIHEKPDEEVIAHLLPVKGIGRWTAEMFLIFSLGRLDVLPVDDLGFRVGVQRQYGFKEQPKKLEMQELGESWRPYRTIATWYIWRSLGGVAQSD